MIYLSFASKGRILLQNFGTGLAEILVSFDSFGIHIVGFIAICPSSSIWMALSNTFFKVAFLSDTDQFPSNLGTNSFTYL